MKKIIISIAVFISCSSLFSAVEFMEFNADVQDMTVILTWSTATETENVGFILERKTDSLAVWDPLASYLNSDALVGQGTVTDQTDYIFRDSSVTSGTYYYRLSGVDEGSVIGVLDSLSITVDETSLTTMLPNTFSLTCYPNPFNPRITINIESQIRDRAIIRIYNIRGSLVENLFCDVIEAGHHDMVWDARNMPSGVYIVKMVAGSAVRSQKIVLLK